VFTYYLKDDLKSLKEKRQAEEKVKFDNKQRVYYPSADSLRLEDSQPDPYLLFTVRDQAGDVVRQIKTTGKKGLHRISWDFRYGTSAPVENRRTFAPDQLFGSEEVGFLALPGYYSVGLSKFENGKFSELAGPVNFSCVSLSQSSLPTDAIANNNFNKKVDDLRKAVSAAQDILSLMEKRIKAINQAALDMPASANAVLERTYSVQQDYNAIKISLQGDGSLASRNFETLPSLSDRVDGIIGGIWTTTSNVTTSYKDSYALVAKQFSSFMKEMKALDDVIRGLEAELELNNAPYTPGRWPEWKE
jgi:hypothetical protein